MDSRNQPPYHGFMKSIGERDLARYYPWILAGLVILYLGTFPFLKAPILSVIPAVVAGWFYYQSGGIAAGIVMIALNLFLFENTSQKVTWEFLSTLENGVLLGHGMSIVAAIASGYMRRVIERYYWTYQQLQNRERDLTLINMATKDILEGRDPEDTYYRLLTHLINLFSADYAFLTSFNESTQDILLLADSRGLSQPIHKLVWNPKDKDLLQSVLASKRAQVIDDLQQPPNVTQATLPRALTNSMRSGILIPLATRNYQFGVALVAFMSHSQFTPDDLERAGLVGNQMALILWNFQQGLEIQQRLKESDALAGISRALSESERVGTGEVLQLIVDSARELMPHAEKSVIHLLEPNAEKQFLFARAVSGYDDQEKAPIRVKMHLGEGVAGQVIREGVTINIGDIKSSPGFLASDSPPKFQSLLVAPVQSGGQQIGTISVQSTMKNAFSAQDANLLNALGSQAAIAIENTNLFETTQQRLKEMNILNQIGRILAASLDAGQLIKDVVSLLHSIIGYYYVQIYLIEPKTGDLVLQHGSGPIGESLVKQGHRLLAGDGLAGHVVKTGKPFFTNNVDEVIFFKRNPLLPLTQSEIVVPIKVDTNVVGVLEIQATAQQRLTEGDFQLIIAIADQLAVALEKARLYGELQTSLQQEQTVRSQLIQSERLALVGRLLASVSHELNNPLQAIQNALFLLKDEERLSPQGKQDLDVVLSEAERMASLIERLRSAYRPGRIKDFRPLEFNNLVEDVHTLITTLLRQKQIAFEFHPEPDLPCISGMSDQLRQVVLNLFLNAVDVMQPGGRLIVWTQSLPPQKEILLTVKDTGPGIAPDILPRVFDAFVTDKQAGTGLGLTITRDIIEQHFGRISAENEPEGGAVFKVWLPMDEKGPS